VPECQFKLNRPVAISPIAFNVWQVRAATQAAVWNTDDAMIEKRAAPRQRVLKRGMIACDGSSVDCLVRNLSATGARVDVESPVALPASFLLVIEADQFLRRGRKVWFKERHLGIAFD
jgi:hypothetical protein